MSLTSAAPAPQWQRYNQTYIKTLATLASDESGSVEHRLEANHLKVLLKARERLQKGAR